MIFSEELVPSHPAICLNGLFRSAAKKTNYRKYLINEKSIDAVIVTKCWEIYI